MFNLGFSELILLGVIALIFIGPQQLPELARTLGRLLNELKRATSDFQSSMTSTLTDDISDRVQKSRKDQEPKPPVSTAHGPEAITSPLDLGPKIETEEPPAAETESGEKKS